MYWNVWWSLVLELSEVRGLCIFGSIIPFLAYFCPPQQISFQLIQETLQTSIKSIKTLDDEILSYLGFCFMLFLVEWIIAIPLLCMQHGEVEDYNKDMAGTYLGKHYDNNDEVLANDNDDEAYDHEGSDENSKTDRIIELYMKIIEYHCYIVVFWLCYVWVKQPERGEILSGYIIIICSMLGKTVVRCREMYFIVMDEIKKIRHKYHIQDMQEYLLYFHNHRCD